MVHTLAVCKRVVLAQSQGLLTAKIALRKSYLLGLQKRELINNARKENSNIPIKLAS